LTAFFRGDDTEEAETGALVLASAMNDLRYIRLKLSGL
jgi:hypothetical protein